MGRSKKERWLYVCNFSMPRTRFFISHNDTTGDTVCVSPVSVSLRVTGGQLAAQDISRTGQNHGLGEAGNASPLDRRLRSGSRRSCGPRVRWIEASDRSAAATASASPPVSNTSNLDRSRRTRGLIFVKDEMLCLAPSWQESSSSVFLGSPASLPFPADTQSHKHWLC